MLFKINQGNSANLPTTLTDGWAYYTTDEHGFYIDHKDGNGVVVRSKISAEFADKLHYKKNGSMIEIDSEDIALKTDIPTSLPANGGNAERAEKDANGNVITATYATKQELSEIDIEQGPIGPAGVYYGTTAPTDPSHPVWINPSGEGVIISGDEVGY